jgi:hypothetical protein
VRTITLKPATSSTYGTAAAFLQFVETGNFSASACSRIASGLKVLAPNTFACDSSTSLSVDAKNRASASVQAPESA